MGKLHKLMTHSYKEFGKLFEDHPHDEHGFDKKGKKEKDDGDDLIILGDPP